MIGGDACDYIEEHRPDIEECGWAVFRRDAKGENVDCELFGFHLAAGRALECRFQDIEDRPRNLIVS